MIDTLARFKHTHSSDRRVPDFCVGFMLLWIRLLLDVQLLAPITKLNPRVDLSRG